MRCPPQGVATFLDGLTGPTAGERLVEELRESGDEPELLAALEARDYERALEQLLEEAQTAEPERRDRVRELMVAIFAELGQDDPLATTYRRGSRPRSTERDPARALSSSARHQVAPTSSPRRSYRGNPHAWVTRSPRNWHNACA